MDLEGKDNEKPEQKSPFENLSHPELVKRCSKFLSIAQSAKHAKDTYKQMLDEAEMKVKILEEKLSKVQQSHGQVQCKECENYQKEGEKLQNQVSAMEEMVATLTEQKLSTAMEIDRLKKQNKFLESQFMDERSELEKRLLATEGEIKSLKEKHQQCVGQKGKKEDHEDIIQQKLLCSELAQLSRALEVLSNDNKSKSEEIKQLSESFRSEKSTLEAELQRISSRAEYISDMNNLLREQVCFISAEKDDVLRGIGSIRTNNFELSHLVESIGSDRDECLHSIEKLNAEKSKLNKLVNALNSSKTTILEENVSLKSEQQHLNECLKKLACERDSLQELVTSVEMHLLRMLHQCVGTVQNHELSFGNHSTKLDETASDKKLELLEVVSSLDNVMSILCTIVNTSKSFEPSLCNNVADDSLDKQVNGFIRCISFENAEETDQHFRQELAAFSSQLSKICNVAVSFKEHERNADASIFFKRIINFLKSNVEILEMELEKRCAGEDGVNRHRLENSFQGLECLPCFDEKSQLDTMNCDKEAVHNKEKTNLEGNQPSSHRLNALSDEESVDSNCLQKIDSSRQCVCTQTDNVAIDSLKESSEKYVQTDMCTGESAFYSSSFVRENDGQVDVLKGCDIHEDNKNEMVDVEMMKNEIQTLHIRYKETSEKLTCAEKELGKLHSIIYEKDADMNKFLDILLSLDGKNSKNAMNQVFEKLQKDKASCEVESIDKAVESESQNVIEKLVLLEESECTNRCNIHHGDVLVGDDMSRSSEDVQNVVDLQKMVSKKKAEILLFNELQSLSENQSKIISKQENEIFCLNKTIEELTETIERLENKIMDEEAELSHNVAKSICHNEVRGRLELPAGSESKTEKQDEAGCDLNEKYSKLYLTFSKQQDELASLQEILDDRNNEIVCLKTVLQDTNAQFDDRNRAELSKLIEQKDAEIARYKVDIEALQLRSSADRESSTKFNQDFVNKNDEIGTDLRKAEDADNINTTLDLELVQKETVIDDQTAEINRCRQEILVIETQLKQVSCQLVEKEEMIDKMFSDIENYKQKIVDIEQNSQELENMISHNQQLIIAKDSEINTWQNNFKYIEEQLKKTDRELVRKQQMCFEKVHEVETFQKEIEELQLKHYEMERRLFQQQAIIANKNEEVEKASSENVERDSKIDVCVKEIQYLRNELKKIITEKDAEIEKHKIECQNMQYDLNAIRDKISLEKQFTDQKDKDTENHRKQIENIMQQCMEAETKLVQKQQVIDEMTQIIDEYKQTVKNMQERFEGSDNAQKKLLDDVRCEMEWLQNDLAVANASCADKNSELKKLKEELCAVQTLHSSSAKTMEEMTEKLSIAELEVAKKEEALTEKIQEIEHLRRSRKAMLEKLGAGSESVRALRASHGELLREGRQLRSSLSLIVGEMQQQLCRQVEAALSSSKTEVKELLGEMNEMNQVLKQRGETISKLKEVKAELEQRWESASSELLGTRETLSERIADLAVKDDMIKAMEGQLESQAKQVQESSQQQVVMDSKLQKATERIADLESKIAQLEQEHEESQKEGGEVPSEVMSSSTISKMEEAARLRDLEGSFEERFTKLRLFTIKLKKKASDLKEQLTQSEAERSKLASEKAELLSKISVMSGHTKNLQTLQQEYDALQDEIEAEKSEVKSLKKALEAAVNDSTAVKLELQNCREEKESLSRELENCTKSKQKLDTSVKELLSQVQNLKKEKEAENIARKEKEAVVKRLEEDLKLKEVKIAEETEKAKVLLDKIEESKQESVKNNVLSLEMAACEEQLRVAKSQQKELAVLVADHETTIGELKERLEQKTEQCENVTVQLAELASEKHNLEDSFRNQQDLLIRQVHTLEEQCTKLKDYSAECEGELTNLRDEFESYKVRAQSVLRQKARGEELSQFSREDLLEETRQLKGRVDVLQTKLEETNLHLQSALSEQEVLREEKTALLERCQELTNNLSQARSQVNQLQETEKALTLEHQDAIRNQKLQHDMLTQCYKSQIEDLEARLRDETEMLRQRLENAEDKFQRQQVVERVDTPPHSRKISADGKTSDPTRHEVEIALLKREDAEGSESTNLVSPQHMGSRNQVHHPVPLDKLLATTDEDTGSADPILSEEMVQRADDMGVLEQQVRHLSALLSDAEQDLAKLTQQNGVLKEEIRRQQRSIEREQHAQNFEYLKNVVVKFATLQSGDERSRLVPVLNTILKLSPEETSQLSQVARGGFDTSGSARGWGSYLHLWPGSQ